MRVPTSFLIAPVLMALCAPAALAQDTGVPSPPQTSSGSGFGGVHDRKEVQFPGGTLAEYAALLRKLFPEDSIVLAPGVADFEIPAITAKVSSPKDALKLASGIDGELHFPTTASRPSATYGGTLEAEFISPGVYRVVGIKKSLRAQHSVLKVRLTTRVFPVLRLLDSGMTIEEILGTLKVAFELQESTPPVLRYHEATGILFIRGTDEQQNIFDATYGALEGVAMERRRSESLQAEHQAFQTAYNELLARYKDLEMQLHVLLESKDSDALHEAGESERK